MLGLLVCYNLSPVFQDLGLNTAWDDQLSYILTSSLSAYETERVTGQYWDKLCLEVPKNNNS